ncbi:uncharacterized protein YpiB (UPF0302 family) [Anoxybacillus calidus]|jgi:uncharacterized protein YpiB (UPF0302 family)|uniref:Uncharacterized protein YpiB (UPF0302 family) n=1 Tax=[Anoxybacillus] calidus TaxID=575178 RepID=A0A7V9Z2I3_9BACL|nr:IDEAL domain-containing protein [Anoxybacillus calidus]MBA2872787.1 uncharacterized protein YpiB (UPF0302 family) [Anoxybacillus calidus]
MKTHKKRYKLVKNSKKQIATFGLSPEQWFTLQLEAQLFLDEMCYRFNKQRLEMLVNDAIDNKDKKRFMEITAIYSQYVGAENR